MHYFNTKLNETQDSGTKIWFKTHKRGKGFSKVAYFDTTVNELWDFEGKNGFKINKQEKGFDTGDHLPNQRKKQ